MFFFITSSSDHKLQRTIAGWFLLEIGIFYIRGLDICLCGFDINQVIKPSSCTGDIELGLMPVVTTMPHPTLVSIGIRYCIMKWT